MLQERLYFYIRLPDDVEPLIDDVEGLSDALEILLDDVEDLVVVVVVVEVEGPMSWGFIRSSKLPSCNSGSCGRVVVSFNESALMVDDALFKLPRTCGSVTPTFLAAPFFNGVERNLFSSRKSFTSFMRNIFSLIMRSRFCLFISISLSNACSSPFTCPGHVRVKNKTNSQFDHPLWRNKILQFVMNFSYVMFDTWTFQKC